METFAKDTDGFMARHFDRRISGAISRQLLRTPITPNQITLGVTVLGVVAGIFMAQPGYAAKVEGAFLFLATSILDGCDGEVARAKKMTSALGGWLDLWGDNVVHAAVFFGLGVGLWKDTGQTVYLLLGKFAVTGTVLSALLASGQMIRDGKSTFTSVAPGTHRLPNSAWTKRLTAFSDALARRDFIYGVVFLSIIARLNWFLWATAIGVNAYAAVLIVLWVVSDR